MGTEGVALKTTYLYNGQDFTTGLSSCSQGQIGSLCISCTRRSEYLRYRATLRYSYDGISIAVMIDVDEMLLQSDEGVTRSQ